MLVIRFFLQNTAWNHLISSISQFEHFLRYF
jgi:hypothetical protein